MMAFWIAAALLTAGVLLALLRPLMRRSVGVEAPGAEGMPEVAIYKDQLAEIERDVARGLLTDDQAAAARTEVSRRLLAADARVQAARAAGAATPTPPAKPSRLLATALMAAVPLLAMGIYLRLGSPDLPGQPAASRTDQGANAQAQAVLRTLQARVADHPKDLEAWKALATTQGMLGQNDKAAASWAQAVDLAPDDANLQASRAEALVLSADGVVGPEAKQALAKALALNPKEPRARYYDGLAVRQAGDLKGAITRWSALLAESPADAPWVPFLRGQLGETATEAGMDPAAVTPQPLPPAGPPATSTPAPGATAPGPTADDVAAASTMSGDDRNAMIRGMVQRLADRLKAQPDDGEGWSRLARAYRVLGENDKAAEAEANAKRYGAATAAAPGTTAGAVPPGMPDPTTMTPEQRSATVKSLLAQFQAAAEKEPDKPEGWARLAQAYEATGDVAKTREAWAKAVAAAPDDAQINLAYARVLLPADGGHPPPAFFTALRVVLKSSPNNPQALWYLGLDAAENGRKAEAKDLWGRLLPLLPEGSDDRKELEGRLKALGT
ncbi:c-type cytochrome biogenesis protein CcmI [Nitrospirillum pindoramense]|uniref:Cytochrome c-type biogenesis protein CcmH n=1 Tax=Nitrospirillum amazonense TaxID=28077 RepID=A0A560GXD7_9PROT|nr:c-type cytochrome biogenesis protein CcmI [Nitrospirillum amazonense]TWB38090.1 cytochrome c-type biogenesis protein CcmH [Nitrospirillum amazonense]